MDSSIELTALSASRRLYFGVCGLSVEICCGNTEVEALVQAVFGAMPPAAGGSGANLSYDINRSGDGYHIHCGRGRMLYADGPDDLLFQLDKDLTVEVQRHCPQLLFVHAGVLAQGQSACIIAAVSGSGKSTTAWSLLNRGFHYLSDELAPIDLRSMTVHPYSRALCLKSVPSEYPLPTTTLHTGDLYYVPVDDLPTPATRKPLPIKTVFFLRRLSDRRQSAVVRLSPAAAAAKLLANALNPLAHGNYGMDAAVAVAERAPCFDLLVTDLKSACEAILGTV